MHSNVGSLWHASQTIHRVLATVKPRIHLKRCSMAARKIQARIRGYLLRKHLYQGRRVCTQLQARFRGALGRAVALRRKHARDAIKAAVLRHVALQQYRRTRRLVTRLQAWFRMRNGRRRYCQRRDAEVLISRMERGRATRREVHALRHAHWRVLSAVLLRCYRRRHEERRAEKCGHIRARRAVPLSLEQQRDYSARRLQAFLRSACQRARWTRAGRMLAYVQACWRRKVAVRWYWTIRRAGAVLVAGWIGFRVRRRLRAKRHAILRIQALWRGYCIRVAMHDAAEAQTTIARWLRQLLVLWHARDLVVDVFKQQRTYRHIVVTSAAQRLQSRLRARLQRRMYQTLLVSTLKVQALARGYLVRLTLIRRRYEEEDKARTIQVAFRGRKLTQPGEKRRKPLQERKRERLGAR